MHKEDHGITTAQGRAYLSATFALGYLCHDTESQLNTISAKTGGEISGFELAARMGEFLLTKASRTSVRGQASIGDQALEPMEMVGRSHIVSPLAEGSITGVKHKRHISAAGLARIKAAQKKRWAGVRKKKNAKKSNSSGIKAWWAKMSPKQRSAEVFRRMNVSKAKKNGKIHSVGKAA